MNLRVKFLCGVVLLLALTRSAVNVTGTASPRVVFIRPVFTAAAYRGYPESSFYGFYREFANVSENAIIKTNLNLLNTSVNLGDWGRSAGLAAFFRNLTIAKETDLFRNATVLTDVDVNNGELFDAASGAMMFDVAVLGFSEYVTAVEYQNYKHFVETGGGLFFLDANNFLAEVKYNPAANTISLVKGHGWEFNGTAAWKGPQDRWITENTDWVGSNYALSSREGYRVNGAIANTTHPLSVWLRSTYGLHIFSSYVAHEENAITNSSDKVIAYWNITGLKSTVLSVAVYEHQYQDGSVIHTGIFGSDLISKDQEMQFFLIAAVTQLAHQPITIGIPEFPSGLTLALTIGTLLTAFALNLYRWRDDRLGLHSEELLVKGWCPSPGVRMVDSPYTNNQSI